ncbi:MAG TPA: HlyD family secretion protein [Bryobacteraceae bacterium]|nr:HlyD family secretion protein [Bryobacteraceae bacterium]
MPEVAEQQRGEAPAQTPPRTPEQPEKKGGLSPAVKWTIAVVVLIALVIGGFMYWSYASVRESTDDAQIDGHIYPVSAMIDGTISDVLVENNQFVQAGAVLGHIDPRYYQAAVDKARGDLDVAMAVAKENRTGIPIATINTTTELSGAESAVAEQNAKIATAERQVAAANERLATAQARVREIQANAAKANSDLDRMKPLVAKEEISRQQYDAVVAAAANANAAVDSAQSQVKEAQQDISVAQAMVDQERAHMAEVRSRVAAAKSGPQQVAAKQAQAESSVAAVQQKQAALAQAEIDLGYAVLRAPVAGLVSQRNMEIGQTVAKGQPLVTIVPLNDLWVTANFKESQLKNMRPGQPVDIDVDAYGKTYKGHVESIAAATGARFSLLPPENATGNYVKVVQRVPVRIFFEPNQDPDHRLRPGMSVTPTVLTK